MRSLLLFALVGCGVDASPSPSPEPPVDAPDEPPLVVDDQSPPLTHVELVPWLADGAYQTWACEAAAHPARPPGAHGDNRICSNTLLSGSDAGRYPIGAASVKELVRDGGIVGYAVMRKVADAGTQSDWFWYEAFGDTVYAEGRSAPDAPGATRAPPATSSSRA